jgi:hypothetical protein
MDPDRHDEDARDETTDEPSAIVDRVRANLGGPAGDDDRPFNPGSLSAWLGDEPPAPRSTEAALPLTAPEREPREPVPTRTPVLRDRRFLLVAGLAALLAVALIGASALAVVNARRADDWRTRAEQVQLRTKIINDLLVERSHDVNSRTRTLNATAAKLRQTRRALTRSESDVRALVRRQSELANEKAQAEDAGG